MGLEIPREFGYVILTGVSSAFVIMYKVGDVNTFPLIINFKIEFLTGNSSWSRSQEVWNQIPANVRH